jgi:capsule polysaccharide export protein KpsE/RkpR
MKINKKMLKKLIEEVESELSQIEVQLDTIPPLANDKSPEIPGVETREDAWAGGDNLANEEDWEALSGISNQKEQEVMKITEAKLRKMIRATILKGMNK